MGLFVFYDGGQVTQDSSRWIFIQYDTNLVKLRSFNMDMPAGVNFTTSCSTGNFIYLLLQKWLSKKEPATNILITLDVQTNRHEIRTINGLTNDNIKYMYAEGEQLVFVSAGDRRDSIFYYDRSRDQVTTLIDIFPYRTEFCTADTANHQWIVGLRQVPLDNSSDMHVFCYNWDNGNGHLIPFPEVRTDDAPLIFQSARAFVLNADSVLIVGTYNTRQDRNSIYLHSGVYTMVMQGGRLDTVRVFNFTSLKSSASTYHSSNLNLQLLVGETSHNNFQYTLISEVYYPEYSYNGNYGGGYLGYDPYYTSFASAPTFAGYHYVNAYVTTFNRNGYLLWDNYFSMDNLILSQLERTLRLKYINDDALLYYTRSNRIISTLLNGYETIEQISSVNIETLNPREAVESCKKTDIRPWYGNNFIVTGYHNLKNKDKAAKAKRNVFFINKLEYR